MRFLFVDRIEEIAAGNRARGIKTVSFEEGFLESPWGEEGAVPRLLVLECAAQLASWLLLHTTAFRKIPLIARVGRLEIRGSVRAGARLAVEVDLLSMNEEGALLAARVSEGGRPVAAADDCVCTLVDAERLVDPEAARAVFAALSREATVS